MTSTFACPAPDVAPAQEPSRLTRRGALGAAGALAASLVTTQLPRSTALAAPQAAAVDPVLHLVRRTTFGPTPSLLAEVRRRGTTAWLDEQMQPEKINDSAIGPLLARYPLVSASAAELGALPNDEARRQATNQLVEATLCRQLWSRRQLLEVMADFWNNHLNSPPMYWTWATKPLDDRNVIRAHAFGRFEDMLLASARSPSMLYYLDNYMSRLAEPNENYGRELLELHTVGLSSGFTETDVLNSAYALTGRTIDDTAGQFLYRPEWHYTGPVRVLGWSSPNTTQAGGLEVGDDYLRYLARHELTAMLLSRKLAMRFVSDDPSSALVSRLARVYLDSGTAIVPWLQALFASPEFAASAGRKTRRPVEDMAASVRALGISPLPADGTSEITGLIEQCTTLGQIPFGCLVPTGYPDIAAGWRSVSGTVKSWNSHHRLATRKAGPLRYPPLSQLLLGPPLLTAGAMADRVSVALTGQIMQTIHRKAVLDAVSMTASAPYDPVATLKELPSVVLLTLNSPYHLLK